MDKHAAISIIVQGAIAAAQIQAMGMLAENQVKMYKGSEPPYDEKHFKGLIEALHERVKEAVE